MKAIGRPLVKNTLHVPQELDPDRIVFSCAITGQHEGVRPRAFRPATADLIGDSEQRLPAVLRAVIEFVRESRFGLPQGVEVGERPSRGFLPEAVGLGRDLPTAEAADRLTATLARDDVAASLREIGEKADFLRESQKSPAPVTAAPAAVTASQRAARAAPPAPLPTDFVSRLAAIKARQAAAREARQGAAKAAPSGQDRAPEMAPRPRF